jgi:hypothetical protein
MRWGGFGFCAAPILVKRSGQKASRLALALATLKQRAGARADPDRNAGADVDRMFIVFRVDDLSGEPTQALVKGIWRGCMRIHRLRACTRLISTSCANRA